MSHFTKVELQMSIADAEKVCKDTMGFTDILKNTKVRGFDGTQQNADLVLRGNRYDIGISSKEGGKLEIVGDWWGLGRDAKMKEHLPKPIAGEDEEQAFRRTLTQSCAESKLRQKIGNSGFNVASRKVQKDGSIKLQLKAWM